MGKFVFLVVPFLASFLLITSLVIPPPAQGITIIPVAIDGNPAPGAPSGSTFYNFRDISMNAAGHISFRAYTNVSSDTLCQHGIWAGPPENFTPVVCNQQSVPDSDPGTYFAGVGGGAPGDAVMNDSGQVAFSARLGGPTTTIYDDESVWLGDTSSLSLVVREGQPAPGTEPGVEFIGYVSSPLLLNDNGHVILGYHLIGPGITTLNDRGIWMGSGTSAPELIVRKGDPVPGMPSGVVFKDIDTGFGQGAAFNDNNVLTFRAQMSGSGITMSNDESLWINDSSGLDLVVREGDPAPDLPAGTVFSRPFGQATLNNAGTMVFYGYTSGGTTPGGLWIGTKGSFNLLAATGDTAPETEAGTVFNRFLRYVINEAGDVAIIAEVTGPSVPTFGSWGIWAGAPGALKLIARDGMPVSSSDPSALMYQLQSSPLFLNDDGDVVLDAMISGIDGGGGVWFRAKDGDLEKVAIQDDLLEVSAGDFRTVYVADLGNSTKQSGNEDGLRSALSDDGFALFRAYFTDSTSGIFLADTREITYVTIDIKPDDDKNTLNLATNGVVPVAILSTNDFDATTVVPESIVLGGCGVKMTGGGKFYLSHWEDVNDDGLLDIVAMVEVLGMLVEGDATVTLAAETETGEVLQGSDGVMVVKPK